MTVWQRLADLVGRHGAAALVSVHAVKGSAPREAGARMAVRPDGAFHGTIGGGRLEWEALRAAREALGAGRGPARFVDQALGPDLAQCCGGRVTLLIETFDGRDSAEIAALTQAERAGPFVVECHLGTDGRVARRVADRATATAGRDIWCETHGEARTPLWLFGAGHVGRALVLALAPLPFAIRWIDSRDDAFPAYVPANAVPVQTADPVREVATAPAGAFVLVMTHEHPLDLAITAAALGRSDLGFVGLIGSATKRARFVRRFREIGIPDERIAALACPIGLPGIIAKEPAVIAASVAAQLLQRREPFGPPCVSSPSG